MRDTAKPLQPMAFKNLADLKRYIKIGTEFRATSHKYHPDIVGLTRVVTKVQTNGFYSKIKDEPDHRFSACNNGKGFFTEFGKAGGYIFDGSTVKVLDKRSENRVIYELEFYRENTEVNSMNEYDRLCRQAQRYREMYPEGTRILLLHMGDDPRPVEDNMRGTVMFVDDMSTVHCKFDNGRQLGIIPARTPSVSSPMRSLPRNRLTARTWTRTTAPLWECRRLPIGTRYFNPTAAGRYAASGSRRA